MMKIPHYMIHSQCFAYNIAQVTTQLYNVVNRLMAVLLWCKIITKASNVLVPIDRVVNVLKSNLYAKGFGYTTFRTVVGNTIVWSVCFRTWILIGFFFINYLFSLKLTWGVALNLTLQKLFNFSKLDGNSLSNPEEYLVKGISNANLTSVWENLVRNKWKFLNNFRFYIFMAILFWEFLTLMTLNIFI